MEEEKKVLSQETLTNVTGGDEGSKCPFNRNFPLKTCMSRNCPYRTGSYCSLYQMDADTTPHDVIE